MPNNRIRLNWLRMSRQLVYIAGLFAVITSVEQQLAVAAQPDPNTRQVATKSKFNVKDFGAIGESVANDTPAIQKAIDAAGANPGGGEVLFPAGTYLLNSTSPSTHPWAYYNLQIESGVTLIGETGAKLLQGPKGRHPVLDDADGVRNSILAFGSDHQIIRFQNPDYNGGFYLLEATGETNTTTTLKTPAESSKFKPGDYVAIYETTEGDVIPTETGRIVSVNTETGQLTLREPLSRSFKTPSIANVTHVATTNVGVKNLILQGSEPLTATETFGFVAEDCHFINDTSIGGKNVVGFNLNTLNGFRFTRNKFTSVGPGHIVLEMTQRNSRHGVWEDNTIEMMQGGMGEYAADIQFVNNTFTIAPGDRTNVGLMIGGKDIVFRANKVTCGTITADEGWGCVLADCVGPGYDRYAGNITIADNTFTYEGNGNQLTHLAARDTSFTGNTVTIQGSAMGVRGEGPPPQTLTISNNRFRMGSGHAVFIGSYGVDGSSVTGNTISGSGSHGIYVASPDQPATGKHTIHSNNVSGFRDPLFVNLKLHPKTVLTAHAALERRESFTGMAARSGTFKRPLLDIAGKRYELTASDGADKSVAQLLKTFSGGDTGRYLVKGTRGTVKGKDGIIVDSIAPATTPESKPTSAATKTTPKSASSAATSTDTKVAVSVVTVGDESYAVYDYDDLTARNYSFVIPTGLKTVRGLLVHGCCSGGDSRYDWKDCEYYRQFLHLHGFAYVGSTSTAGPPVNSPSQQQPIDNSAKARHHAIFDAFVESVPIIADASRHPEMVNAPYAGVGFSAGGGYSLNMMVFAPEKTIAAVSYCSPYNFKRRATFPVSDAVLRVPSIAITGEEEQFNAPFPPNIDPAIGPAKIDEVFVPYRPKGAKYAWLERQDQGHSYFENRQDVLGMPLLDAAVRARYPNDGDVTKGPIKLIDIGDADGWIADNTSWKSGLTKIIPAKEFQGNLGHSSWLQNEDLAFIYRAYSTYDNPLTITSPGECWPTMPALEPGASVPITVDASLFPDWKTIAFYDGAKKLGVVSAGTPPQFWATDLTPGYHVFSILASDDDGLLRTADPKLVIVKPVRDTATATATATADADADATDTDAAATPSGVTVVRSFPANKGPGWKSSIDVAGAVGPNHVVDFDVASFVVHNKTNGEILRRLSTQNFW